METPSCPACDTPYDSSAYYCNQCGHKLVATDQTTRLYTTETIRTPLSYSAFNQTRIMMMLVVTAVISFLGGYLLNPVVVRSIAQTPVEPTPTIHPSSTPLPNTPEPSPSVTPAYLAINIQEYSEYTVYWKRHLWEEVVGVDMLTEDFSLDESDYGELSFPYLTGHGLLLQGKSAAQIIESPSLLDSGTLLHFRDWEDGLTIHFPEDTTVQALGFNYKPSEDWQLNVADANITIPEGRRGFVGVVFHSNYPNAFVLSTTESAQGGLTVDNIAFIPSPSP